MTEVKEVAALRTPRVGDKVLVRHRSKANKKGETVLEATKPYVDRVKLVMLDGDVIVGCGDLWKIKRSGESNAEWVTTGTER